ncbi:MAG: ATP-dependent helicase [Actinobacteria bacterium]|nr:ATP-dependent helicase [Actinomycetota bacterium]
MVTGPVPEANCGRDVRPPLGQDGPVPDFSPATQGWFEAAFAAPTPAQSLAWESIRAGRDTLVVAPTGSGKTLAAFLSAIDDLASDPECRVAGPKSAESAPQLDTRRSVIGPRVLYVSPLKALAVDIERNLRAPLAGIQRESQRLDLPVPDIRVGVRTGDTPADERRRMTTSPPDILITTPESLFLLLTSQARSILGDVRTVIIDEIHALAGTKRGAHLALSLERLDVLRGGPGQRIGLSATVEPHAEVARFLRPQGDVAIVAPPTEKSWDLSIVVPVPDMTAMGEELDIDGSAAADPRRTSIWPHVEERVVDLVSQERSSIVFANSRGLAERLTGRLNEVAEERGLDLPLARAHHGSVSREQRAIIEEDLKAARLPAVVATSTLELGIDMGAVDLVVQVESPPSVASGLQRVGRAGHQVGAISRGVVFPKYRGDLLQAAVVVERMRAGAIEPLRVPANPLDVLAQQVIAMVAMDTWDVEELYDVIRRAAPYRDLPRDAYLAVLDMLAGRYPGDDFAELKPRIVWDRVTGEVTARPGAQRLAVTSGGTIPDRGLYAVYLIGTTSRVGELDEEMVYESRVGDVFALGATSWRIEEITPDRVWVSPAPGQSAKLPFWHGDSVGRPIELGRAVGEFLRTARDPETTRAHLADSGLDAWAMDNLVAYLEEQRAATGRLPDDRTIVVERFRDELGDWRVAIHSPFGARVHAPWALAIGQRLLAEHGIEPQVMHSDDGIVIRLPDTLDETSVSIADLLVIDPEDIDAIVQREVGGSSLFAGRFRECAARALLLPRRMPGKRSPLWQQRQRSQHLLSVASRYPDFPIVLEAVRECVLDVYDVPALRDLLSQVRDGRVKIVDVVTDQPSPFAQSLVFGYVAAFLYEGDSPLAERRSAALTLDADLLGQLLGPTPLRDLLDADAIEEVTRSVGRWEPAPRDAEDLADLLRVIGPLDAPARAARGIDEAWVEDLIDSRRAVTARIAGREHLAAIEDAGRLRDALGVALPPGIPDAFLEITADPLGDLVARHARTHGPFTAADLADTFGLGISVAEQALRRLEVDGRVVSGGFRSGTAGTEWCDRDVLRRIRRRSVAALREEMEPLPADALADFLPAWQELAYRKAGVDAVYAAIESLAGCPLPASQLESAILPARVRDYAPAMLDELITRGEVAWWGAGALPGDDGWVCLAPADLAPLLVAPSVEIDGELEQRIVDLLSLRGARFLREIADDLSREALVPEVEVARALRDLAWTGHVTNDTWEPMRRGAPRKPARPPRLRSRGRRPVREPLGGRWSLVVAADPSQTARHLAAVEALLHRNGIVTREAVAGSGLPGGFAAAYRILSAMEEAGRCRRVYALDGQGAAQFALPGALDMLRSLQPSAGARTLAAADPAQPYGALLPWPEAATRPSRAAGAWVTLCDRAPALYLARGRRSLLTWSDDADALASAAQSLAQTMHGQSVNLQRIDGVEIAGIPADDPRISALLATGFVRTPGGLRLRG